jgi:hypothetical protein
MHALIMSTLEVLRDVMQCRLGEQLSTFERSECLHLQDQTVQENSLKLPAFETPIIIYQSTWCNVERLDASATTV